MYTTLIETQELAELLPSADCVVLDCRFDLSDPLAGEAAWRRGHLPLAHYVHLDRDMASAPGETSGRHPLPEIDIFGDFLGSVGVTPGVQVVAYDEGAGAIAARMWWLLRWVGHRPVAVLNGGIGKWSREGRPLLAEVPPLRKGRYSTETREDYWIPTDQLESSLPRGDVILVDARDPARYRGDEEPVDSKAGHIPGALNLPFRDNLNEDGTFRSPEELRQRFHSVAQDERSVCHSCGSGVTACHNLLAMAHAGLPPGRLYVGSWSEWIRDPARPVALGNEPGDLVA